MCVFFARTVSSVYRLHAQLWFAYGKSQLDKGECPVSCSVGFLTLLQNSMTVTGYVDQYAQASDLKASSYLFRRRKLIVITALDLVLFDAVSSGHVSRFVCAAALLLKLSDQVVFDHVPSADPRRRH
jgi:hypothetical protein